MRPSGIYNELEQVFYQAAVTEVIKRSYQKKIFSHTCEN